MSRQVCGRMAVARAAGVRMVTAGAALASVVMFVMFGAVTPAAASQGSIPEQVAAYASDPAALLATLDDFAGVNASGQGIDFRDGAAVGAVSRIFGFTRAWSHGTASDPSVELRNEWAAPITIDDKPVGVAIIWINVNTVTPELADFIQDAGITAAVEDVPAEAWLVRDEPRGAWFTLTGTELSVVEPGTSGVNGTSSLAAYQSLVTGQDAQPAQPPSSVVMPAVIVGAVSLVILAAVLVPLVRRRSARSP